MLTFSEDTDDDDNDDNNNNNNSDNYASDERNVGRFINSTSFRRFSWFHICYTQSDITISSYVVSDDNIVFPKGDGFA